MIYCLINFCDIAAAEMEEPNVAQEPDDDVEEPDEAMPQAQLLPANDDDDRPYGW